MGSVLSKIADDYKDAVKAINIKRNLAQMANNESLLAELDAEERELDKKYNSGPLTQSIAYTYR